MAVGVKVDTIPIAEGRRLACVLHARSRCSNGERSRG